MTYRDQTKSSGTAFHTPNSDTRLTLVNEKNSQSGIGEWLLSIKSNKFILFLFILLIGFITYLFVDHPVFAVTMLFYLFIVYQVITNSKTGIILLALSFPFIRNTYAAMTGDFHPLLFYSVFLSAIFFIMYGNVLGHRIRIPALLLHKILIIFTIYLFFSIFHISSDRVYGMEKMRYFIMNVILYFLPVLLIRRREDLTTVFKGILYFGFFFTIYSILSYLDMEPFFGSSIAGRFSTLDVNPIWMARYLTYAIMCELYFIGSYLEEPAKNVGKILGLTLIIILQLYFALLTASRGPVLAMLVSLIVIVMLHVRFRIAHLLGFLTILLVIVVLVLSFVPMDIAERLLSRDDGGQTTTILRLMINLDALEVFWSNKITGTGLGSFSIFYLKYPHNILTESLAELGIIGFFLLSSMLIMALYYLFRIYKSIMKLDFYFILALFLAAFVNANLSGHIGSNFYLFFSMGIIAAVYASVIRGGG